MLVAYNAYQLMVLAEKKTPNPQHSSLRQSPVSLAIHRTHGSLNVPIFHITQPLDSMIGINGLFDGYFFR